MDQINSLSPSVLAFVGDAAYGLAVRTRLAAVNRPSAELHRLSVQYVSAPAQSKAYCRIAPFLTEAETAVFKRGRNFQTHSIPKHATIREYHTATGLECLFGFLYLTGSTDRMEELFRIIWEALSDQPK